MWTMSLARNTGFSSNDAAKLPRTNPMATWHQCMHFLMTGNRGQLGAKFFSMKALFSHQDLCCKPFYIGWAQLLNSFLTPRSRFMRPNTPHYVLTVDHSITYSRHFYATSTIRDTCWAIVHCTIGSNTFTNTERPHTTQLLRRILLWSLEEYERGISTPSQSNTYYPAPEHRMDPQTTDGLLDLVTLGNLIEFLPYLDRRCYSNVIPPSKDAETEHARLAFTNFKSLFCANQHLIIDTRKVDPMTTVFDTSLLRFAVNLVSYKKNRLFDDGITPLELSSKIMEHLSQFHPQLHSRFACDIRRPQEELPYLRTFDWTGPHFMVAKGAYVETQGQEISGSSSTYRLNNDSRFGRCNTKRRNLTSKLSIRQQSMAANSNPISWLKTPKCPFLRQSASVCELHHCTYVTLLCHRVC
jgi:hypothetical protein